MSGPDLAALLVDAPPEMVGRTMLAVAAMHEPDGRGLCRYCRPRRWRWWQRGTWGPCPTQRVMVAGLCSSEPASRWVSA